jgi:hypothetical protein
VRKTVAVAEAEAMVVMVVLAVVAVVALVAAAFMVAAAVVAVAVAVVVAVVVVGETGNQATGNVDRVVRLNLLSQLPAFFPSFPSCSIDFC